jgi:S-formylglutathione hydrolase
MGKILKFGFSAFISLLICTSAYTQTNGDFKVIEIPAPSLKNNLVGTSDVQKIGVYLPPSYHKSQKRYPVVYYLNGFTVQAGQYPPTGWVDSIMSAKLVQDMIFVELGGYNMFQGSMYANSPVTGNWEDFVVKDVVSYIDKNYRTLAKRESRGIAGHSMGGAGTFNISLKHPDIFAVAYPMSPAIGANELGMLSMFADGNAMKILVDLSKKMEKVSDKQFASILAEEIKVYKGGLNWLLAYGTAFAPDLSQPLRIALPYQLDKEGKMIKDEKNYQAWENGFGNIEQRVKDKKDNLLKYRHFSIDCGYYDNIIWIYESSVLLSKYLNENKIPHSLHLYNGDHVNRVAEQLANRVMPIMSAYLAKD